MNEIILIDKPSDMTSFGVVARVRRKLSDQATVTARATDLSHRRIKVKVGHSGTLDPFATGLLILLAGRATKRADEFLKLDKSYEATLRFGFTSTTGDPEGEITPFPYAKLPTEAEIRAALPNFTGKITQTPPAFSAIKIGGRRAYDLARAGQEFTIPSRQVEIYSIDLLSTTPSDDPPPTTTEATTKTVAEARILVHCSSGTYIRTLAEDLGKFLGSGAYLTALRRLTIGPYDIKDATSLDTFMAE
ncbi:tRNA pseudouridine(55) synthase TruB [Candidatus Saccharibacteria bacterium]|nr:tRNA pseudouridine(55) synthase TruB [Candidatus Saccharibacteria bacterium]